MKQLEDTKSVCSTNRSRESPSVSSQDDTTNRSRLCDGDEDGMQTKSKIFEDDHELNIENESASLLHGRNGSSPHKTSNNNVYFNFPESEISEDGFIQTKKEKSDNSSHKRVSPEEVPKRNKSLVNREFESSPINDLLHENSETENKMICKNKIETSIKQNKRNIETDVNKTHLKTNFKTDTVQTKDEHVLQLA